MNPDVTLKVPKADAIQLLDEQVSGGLVLLGMPISPESLYDEASRAQRRWDQTNRLILGQIFSNESILDHYHTSHGRGGVVAGWIPEFGEILQSSIRDKISSLTGYMDAVERGIIAEQGRGEARRGSSSESLIQVFISHSSKDADFVRLITDLLINALPIERAQIRATSVNGFKLPIGAETSPQLLSDLQGCHAVIGVLTGESLVSMFVMFELGAAWGLEKFIAPIRGPGGSFDKLMGPLKGQNVADHMESHAWYDLIRSLASALHVSERQHLDYLRYVEQLTTYKVPEPEN